MAIQVYDTLTRSKMPFEPREAGKVTMYVCGPTVYNHIHVGNARSAIAFDVIRRYLVYRGLQMRFVQNYTDVDDKIIDRAHQEGRTPEEIVREYSDAYEKVMRELAIDPPDVLVRATDHIQEMIEMIAQLIERGHGYASDGNVWFSVESFNDYGKLSGRTLDDVRAGERVEPDPSKRNPLDFALWKAAKPGEPSWESPWGPGRPGWHIECSAMSRKYLGMGFDIHGGGTDLIFPHHENEIAQAEGASGQEPFVRYWLHNGMVRIGDEKMSKSLGNFTLAKDLLEKVSGKVVRLVALAAHYRSDMDFGGDQIEAAKRAWERIDVFARAAGERVGPPTDLAEKFVAQFEEAMDDDFNTPVALSVLHELIRHGNAQAALASEADSVAEDELAGINWAFRRITSALGIEPEEQIDGSGLVGPLVELLLEVRTEARKSGRYEDSDHIRARLAELGVTVEDGPNGSTWRLTI